ncbi:MAG: hypothetical protein AVDCRST_MAG02-4474, partial [uncultured Rubrobacteraceae bacterium]
GFRGRVSRTGWPRTPPDDADDADFPSPLGPENHRTAVPFSQKQTNKEGRRCRKGV